MRVDELWRDGSAVSRSQQRVGEGWRTGGHSRRPMADVRPTVWCHQIHQQRVTLTPCPLPPRGSLTAHPTLGRPALSPGPTAPGSHACRSLRCGTPRTISHPFPGECYLSCQLTGPGVGLCCCLCVCQPWPTIGVHWSGKVDLVSHDLETVLGSFIPSSSRVIQDHLGVICLLRELCLTLSQGNKID